MSRFRFELATEADDADLREVLRRTPMGGTIQVTFRREPNYFGASPVDGPFRQVVVCRDTQTGRVVGFGLRAVRQVYVNGEPRAVGYLGSLRVLEEYRNIGLVARGYRFFRELHQDGRTPLYLTTIAEGNTRAIEVLTSGRAGLPRYHFAGLYHTAALPMRRVYPGRPPCGLSSEAARAEDLPKIVAFLNREGPHRQFFPVLREEDFFGPQSMMLGLAPEDIYYLRNEEQLHGVMAAWDQQSYKQTVVDGYSGALGWLRPLLNVGAWFGSFAPLPAPGRPFRYLMAAIPLAGDWVTFVALLAWLGQARRDSPHDYLLLGMHERDLLWPRLRDELRPRTYTTRLYLVCWEDGEEMRRGLDDRPPYLELGCL